VHHPYTGATMLQRLDVKHTERMAEYGTFAPSETEKVPAAYLVPASLDRVVDLLEAHGIRFAAMAAERAIEVEEFEIAANDAFAAVPKPTLDKALGDPNGLLTTVLTYHVVPGQLTPDQLPGSHKTLQGDTIQVTGSGQDFKVNGDSSVVCGNVKTANATVYLIDQVLLPKS
jgi:uncharacterized surface protein with fasciclin (FAS1) repeats